MGKFDKIADDLDDSGVHDGADSGAYDEALDDLVDEESVARKSQRGSRFMRFILTVAIMAGAGYGVFYGYTVGSLEYAKLTYSVKLGDIKEEFLRRQGFINGLTDQEKYLDSKKYLVKWYFKELKKLEIEYAKYPTLWDIDARSKELDEKVKKGLIDARKKEAWNRAFALAREAYTALRDSEYELALSGSGKGTRLDFVRVGRQKIEGQERIKADFYLWGVFPGLSFRDIALSLLNENGNSFGDLSGSGPPELLLMTPVDQIRQFPPGVAFGYYSFDMMPFIVKHVNLSFTYEGQSASGASEDWTYKFEKIPVPADWKLSEDANWDRSQADDIDIDLRDEATKKMTAKERLEAASREADRRAEEEAREAARKR